MGPADDSQRTTDAGNLPTRTCGRCRKSIAGDPTLTFQTDWALCPTCEAVLLGR
jgi:hypothetical protein